MRHLHSWTTSSAYPWPATGISWNSDYISSNPVRDNTPPLTHTAKLHPDDARLLEEDGKDATEQKRSRHHNKNVSWLRKTEYISTEYNRFTQSSDKQESRLDLHLPSVRSPSSNRLYQVYTLFTKLQSALCTFAFHLRIGYKKNLKDDVLYRDRQSQLRAIEDTFTDAELPVSLCWLLAATIIARTKPIPSAPSRYPGKHLCIFIILFSNQSWNMFLCFVKYIIFILYLKYSFDDS